jgi:hypothetical protein
MTLIVDAGNHELKVVRAGLPPCERRVSVEAKAVEVVTCSFNEPPPRGQLVLEGIRDDHIVFVDDEEISREAAREPIPLVPDTPHHVEVRRGDTIVLSLDKLSVASGKVVRKAIVEGAAAPGRSSNVGYLLADTIPPARVLIDGKDTGLTTPITAKDRIPLAAGQHRVSFIVGSQSIDVPVMIEAGKNKQLRRDLPVNR